MRARQEHALPAVLAQGHVDELLVEHSLRAEVRRLVAHQRLHDGLEGAQRPRASGTRVVAPAHRASQRGPMEPAPGSTPRLCGLPAAQLPWLSRCEAGAAVWTAARGQAVAPRTEAETDRPRTEERAAGRLVEATRASQRAGRKRAVGDVCTVLRTSCSPAEARTDVPLTRRALRSLREPALRRRASEKERLAGARRPGARRCRRRVTRPPDRPTSRAALARSSSDAGVPPRRQ